MGSARLRLHPAVELLPTVISRSRYLSAADISDGLALGEELISGTQLANDLLGRVAFAFHRASPGQVWQAGKFSSGLVQFLGST